MLTLRVMRPIEESARLNERLPLALPSELWAGLTPTQRAVYQRAESLLEAFSTSRDVSLSDLLSRGPRGEVLRALEVLGGMELISVRAGEVEPVVRLIAVPSEHVRIVGPDGNVRWLFVAQPLDPPVVDPANLN